jgi:hypothetical protein
MAQDRRRLDAAELGSDGLQRRLVPVDGEQAPARPDALQDQSRVAAEAEGAVNEGRPRLGSEELYRLL